MNNYSNYEKFEDFKDRIEDLLISKSIINYKRKITPQCAIKIVSGLTIAFLDKRFFEEDIHLFYELSELNEEEIVRLFKSTFKGVFNLSLDGVRIIK